MMPTTSTVPGQGLPPDTRATASTLWACMSMNDDILAGSSARQASHKWAARLREERGLILSPEALRRAHARWLSSPSKI